MKENYNDAIAWQALKMYKLAYLATPYTKYHFGLDAAFKGAALIAGEMIKRGVIVYSPIAHTHPIAHEAVISKTDPLWYRFNHNIMRVCDVCVVGMMPGWETSMGVIYERGFFEGQGKPINFLCPDTLALYARLSDLPRTA